MKKLLIALSLLSGSVMAQIGPQGPPVFVQVSPTTGSGAGPTTFAVVAWDSSSIHSAANFTSIELLFASNSGFVDTPNCHAIYYMLYNVVGVYDDDGTIQWMTPGSGSSHAANRCSITAAGAHFTNNGNGYGTAYFPLTFNSGTFSGQHYPYVWINANTPQGFFGSNWARQNGAIWTVPSGGGGLRKGDSRVTQEISDAYPQYGIDAYTGATVLMPTSLHPLVSLNLSTASQDNPDFLAINAPFVITIRHAKPNQQVYIWEDDDNDPGVAQGAHTTGGYVGSTDNSGYIAWNTNVLPNYTGYRTYFIYVGNWGGSSTGPIPEEFAVGGLVLWATGVNGLPAFPSFTQ